ncbi:15964_t:CDS:1 [Gigaspora margarita]|uniref:15964_t:CDS:1 n=1 Tax=Gigaspora margarita TaxID=4874 RepID=A0ABM8W4I5_GIGMA|nr:15964_t:CDS:1 [Gigaspora margarita]
MKLDNIMNLYTKSQKKVEWIHDEQKILTLKMDGHIAKYIGISNPNFIAIIRCSINLYKWIQQKNSHKELLTIEEKILIEEKLEDGKTLSVKDGIKVDHFLPNKKRNIDDSDSSSTKKKIENRIRIAEMTLNESEMEVLSNKNLEEAENKAVLLYAECGCLDYRVENTKEMISLFNKKEKFFRDRTDKSTEPLLEEILVTKTNLNVESKNRIAIDSSYNNIKLDLQTRLILWNLLASSRLAKIRHCFSHFGKITATEWRDFNKTRAVFISIQCKNKKKKFRKFMVLAL